MSFPGLIERLKAKGTSDLEEYEDDYRHGENLLQGFHLLPDESKTQKLLEQLQQTREAIQKAADAKLEIVKHCAKLEEETAALLSRRCSGKARLTITDTEMVAIDDTSEE
jgi:hypothetical protein